MSGTRKLCTTSRPFSAPELQTLSFAVDRHRRQVAKWQWWGQEGEGARGVRGLTCWLVCLFIHQRHHQRQRQR